MSDALTWSPTAPMGPRPPDVAESGWLAAGTRLHEFEIVRVLGAGGFGVVYLALDHVLQRQVAIKEYMPAALAVRRDGTTVALRSVQAGETFALGLDSFINEARLLASFDHPSLVKVHRFWRANGTAYMVTPYYQGQTLKEARRAMAACPDAGALLAFINPLLGALEVLHREGVYHRDISPENVLLLPDGKPMLLDFGSARRVIADRTQPLTALIKPNFAPVEQYADEAGMRQGPWTDLYALGATAYFMLTAQPPTPAVMRAVSDALPRLASQGERFAGVPRQLLASIDWTLAVAPGDRPQSVAALRQALRGEIVPPVIAVPGAVDLPPASLDTPFAARHSLLAAGLLACAGVLAWFVWVLASALPAAPRMLVANPAVAASRPVRAAEAPAPPPVAVLPAPVVSKPAPIAAIRTLRDSEPVVVAAKPPPARVAKASTRPDATAAAGALPKRSGPSPHEVCSNRNFLTRAICMNRQCQAAHARGLPECAEVRRADAERQRRMDQQ